MHAHTLCILLLPAINSAVVSLTVYFCLLLEEVHAYHCGYYIHCKNMRIILINPVWLPQLQFKGHLICMQEYQVVSFPLLATRETMVVFPVTGFPNWKYVAVLATFLAPDKLSEKK